MIFVMMLTMVSDDGTLTHQGFNLTPEQHSELCARFPEPDSVIIVPADQAEAAYDLAEVAFATSVHIGDDDACP
jgi:hypothetical protein